MLQRILCLLLAVLVAAPARGDIEANGEVKNMLFEKKASDGTGTEAQAIFNTTTKKVRVHNGTAWQDLGSGGSGGSAGVNLVTNGNFEDASITGWNTFDDTSAATPADGTGGTVGVISAAARTTTAGELISGTGSLKLVKGSGDARGEGWSYDVTAPANTALKSQLNSWNFNYYMSTASGPGISVHVRDTTNNTWLPVQFDTCGSASNQYLAATTASCSARLYWQATTSVTYRIVFFVAETTSTAVNLFVDDVHFGERILGTGPTTGPVTAFSPSVGGVTSDGTTSYNSSFTSGQWSRQGEIMRATGSLILSTVTSAPTGSLTIKIPGGLTRNLSKCGNTTAPTQYQRIGGGTFYDASATALIQVYIRCEGGGNDEVTLQAATSTAIPTLAASDEVYFDFTVPISEWAGGTSIGDGHREEVYNSDTSTSNDTSSFATGPGGVAIGSYTSTTAGAVTTKGVQFLTDFVEGRDAVWVEIYYNGNWLELADTELGWSFASNSYYGIRLMPVAGSLKRYNVQFGGKGAVQSNASYAGNGDPWSSWTSYKWKVVKIRGGLTTAPVADCSTTGLISTTTQCLFGSKTWSLPNGGSATITGLYTASSTTNDFLVVQRDGGSVKAAIGYDDANTRMYVGTRTNHHLALMANAGVGVLINGSQDVRFPGSTYAGKGVVQTDATGNLTKSNVWWAAAQVTGADCTSGTCTLSENYGGGIASIVHDGSTGDYTVNFTGSFWSATPVCIGSQSRASSQICAIGNGSTSSVDLKCYTDAGAAVNTRPSVNCFGPRS